MKLGVYTIVNDPLPKLKKIKDIVVNVDDFKYIDRIVKIFQNKLDMAKLDCEMMYALSLTFGLEPRGIILLGVGSNQSTVCSRRTLGTGLLLTGAEQFMMFHNHPGRNSNVSVSDKHITQMCNELGNLLEIDFISHIMIYGNKYKTC